MKPYSIENTKKTKVLISQVNALIETINDILYKSNVSEHGRYTSYKEMASIYNDLVLESQKMLSNTTLIYSFNIQEMPGQFDAGWSTQKKILEQVFFSAKMLLSNLEGNIDFVDEELDNLENFLISRLRSAIFAKPTKEIEIQNAIESLLLGRNMSKGIDYDRETGKFEFSGKEFIPDFIIPKLELCIEVKLLREGKKSQIIEEISADITAYSKIYQNQLFIIYDLGVIQNEIEFKNDIEKSDNVKVIIIKH